MIKKFVLTKDGRATCSLRLSAAAAEAFVSVVTDDKEVSSYQRWTSNLQLEDYRRRRQRRWSYFSSGQVTAEDKNVVLTKVGPEACSLKTNGDVHRGGGLILHKTQLLLMIKKLVLTNDEPEACSLKTNGRGDRGGGLILHQTQSSLVIKKFLTNARPAAGRLLLLH
ncbi:hypothetical protein O0L34_g2050 [Tuta absoluta]|nr:hypothetical protein O0L34_g2050 [Tuta absoluta]